MASEFFGAVATTIGENCVEVSLFSDDESLVITRRVTPEQAKEFACTVIAAAQRTLESQQVSQVLEL